MKKFLVFIGIMFMSIIVYGCNNDTSSSSVSSITTSSESSSSVVVTSERELLGVVTCDSVAVEGVTVRIRNTNYTTTTDANGSYKITILEADAGLVEFRVIASKDGYTQQSIDVLEGSFVSGKYTLNVALETATVEIKGVVSSASSVIEGATVVIKNTSLETTTDVNGTYSFVIDRPLELELEVSYDYYKTSNIILNNFISGSVFTQDFILEENITDVSGKVSHFYLGAIEGATVTIRDTEYATTTSSDGSFVFNDVNLKNDNYVIDLVKEGYVTTSYEAADLTGELEMALEYSSLGKFAPNAGDFEGFVTKSSEGFYFKFVSPEPFRYENGKEEKVQLYIDVNDTTTSRGGDTVVEFAMTSNNGVIVVVSYATEPVTFLSGILWGDEVNYVHEYKDGITTLSLFIKYSIFNDYAGTNFAIDANSVVGLALGEFSFFEDVPTSWNPWTRDDMLGYDGKPAVEAGCPADYVRLLPDNTLYEATDNVSYPIETRTINGVVSSVNGVVKDLSVGIPALNIYTTTNELGEYTLTIPDKYFGVSKFNVQYQLQGYLTQTLEVNRIDFIDKVVSKNITMEVGFDKASVSGNIVTFEGKNEGFTVGVKDSDLSVVTGLDGIFSIEGISVDSLPYTLVISKTGYISQEIQVDTLTEMFSDIELIKDYQLLGVAGQDKLNVYVTRTLDSFYFRYATAADYRGDLGDEVVHQYLSIGDQLVDVRFVKNGWTGIWDVNAANWRMWTPQVHNPIVNTVDGVTTITQQVEYAYFANLSAADKVYLGVEEESGYYHEGDVVDSYVVTLADVQVGGAYYNVVKSVPTFVGLTLIDNTVVDVTNVTTYVKVMGNVPEGNLLSGTIVSFGTDLTDINVTVKDGTLATVTDMYGRFEFTDVDAGLFPLTLVISKPGYVSKEVIVNSIGSIGNVELIKEYTLLGKTGHDEFDVYITRTLDSFLFKYVTNGLFRTDGGEEMLHQYIIYNDNNFDVRFVNNPGWTGIWNVNANAWAPWSPDVNNPVITTVDGVVTITQTVKYAYFATLGGNCEITATTDISFAAEETSPFYHENDVYTITAEDLNTGFLAGKTGFVEGDYTIKAEDVLVGGAFYSLTREMTTVKMTNVNNEIVESVVVEGK